MTTIKNFSVKLRALLNRLAQQPLITNSGYLSHKKRIHRLFLSLVIVGISIATFGNLISESKANDLSAQEILKSKSDRGKKTIPSSEEAQEFMPNHRSSMERFFQIIGKVLASEDGRTTKEHLEQIFSVKLLDRPLSKVEIKRHPLMTNYYFRPDVDWHDGFSLTRNESYSNFTLIFNSTFCIRYQGFREIAKNAGWKLSELAYFYHPMALRERYKKDDDGAGLFVDFKNDGCIELLAMSNFQ